MVGADKFRPSVRHTGQRNGKPHLPDGVGKAAEQLDGKGKILFLQQHRIGQGIGDRKGIGAGRMNAAQLHLTDTPIQMDAGKAAVEGNILSRGGQREMQL